VLSLYQGSKRIGNAGINTAFGFGFIHAANLPAGLYTLNVDLTFGRDAVRDITVSSYMLEQVSIVNV